MKHFTLEELQSMPTLSESQTANLKYQLPKLRVWLTRTGIEDGEPYDNKVMVERFTNGKWYITEQYEAK